MSLLFLSFFAGILTVLAPCVLPVLPVVIGGSLADKNKLRPFVITLSLGISIVLFTLLLKVSTLLIEIPQDFWKWVSGGIITFFGIITLFPNLWEAISLKLGFSSGSAKLLSKAGSHKGIGGMILIGASLGPVFASCSPIYFVILATVLPASFAWGLTNLIAYGAGLFVIMFIIAFLGQKAIARFRWAADPHGKFRKGLGILFLVVGISIFTGYEKKFESWLLDTGFNITKFEETLLEKFNPQMPSTPMITTSVGNETTFSFQENYPAPQLKGLQNWINSEGFSSMEELKGKVVLVDFWTYSCINCIRTLPYIQALHEKYANKGLVILGIHAPEFAFEKDIDNVQKAVENFGLTYPVVQDNDFQTWRNYKNRYWPAKYLIDQDGFVRYHHFGEGEYEETEQAVVALLGTEVVGISDVAPKADFQKIGTHETYLGTRRRENMIKSDQTLGRNEWKLTGEWDENGESVLTSQLPASISMNFTASKANLVMGGDATAEIYLDGKLWKTIHITQEQLYNVADFGSEYGEHEIEIRFTEGENIQLYAWTFG